VFKNYMGRFKTMMPTTQSSQSGKSSVGNPPAAPKLGPAQPTPEAQAALNGLPDFQLPDADIQLPAVEALVTPPLSPRSEVTDQSASNQSAPS
jgi:hypothetical protein